MSTPNADLAPTLRDYLRANLFDGDEGGVATQKVSALLDDICEVVEMWQADALLRVHVKMFDGYLHADICTHCSDEEGRSWALWPCEAVRSVTGEPIDSLGTSP